eukprot:2985785-Alexandrium_andersonii.AAC.1
MLNSAARQYYVDEEHVTLKLFAAGAGGAQIPLLARHALNDRDQHEASQSARLAPVSLKRTRLNIHCVFGQGSPGWPMWCK